ncbi:2-dehydropantoate 2-reductase [Marihabitans asiaticum]|uniref:2-dehydropantoate 2-reductase n=1 Tax=Marihabitans asiaticum TaxID=415218 RepID=A0A560WED9_9MICO|nr:2-dehydropantoate 2-reductase [Marihabitans asiaticum]TWD15904.1 ketopantoate reductase [Marihabitans asiaticum]
MRVAIVGAGKIGCYLAAHLASVAEVSLVARAPVVEAARSRGLTAIRLDGTRAHAGPDRLVADTEMTAAAGADVVLVTTKATDNPATAAQLGPHVVTDTLVVSLQNGIRNAQVIEEGLQDAFPSRASRPLVLPGVVHHNVVEEEPGVYAATTSGGVTIKDHPRSDPFARLARRSGLNVELHPDMRAVLMAKLLLNLNNAVNALSGLPLRRQLKDRDLRLVLAACQQEALRVSRAAGVSPARLGAIPAELMPHVLRTPTPVFSALARTTLTVSAGARSSMADDLDRGGRTEIDELQGVVVAFGEHYDVPTPVCERVVQLVVDCEIRAAAGAEQRRWTGPELRAEVGL